MSKAVVWSVTSDAGFFYCDCGAVTPFLLVDGKKFFLGSYKHHQMKHTTGGKREADCLWCGENHD